MGGHRHLLHQVQESPPIAIGIGHQQVQCVLVQAEARQRQGCHRALGQRREVLTRQRLQRIDLRTGQQRIGHLQTWVFGGAANQNEQARLHMREQRILLRLAECVDLIDEHDRPAALRASQGLCRIDHGTDVLDARTHGRQQQKLAARDLRGQAGDGGFAHPRWAPQNEGMKAACFECQSQRPAGADQVLLAHHVLKPLGPQAFGQGRDRA